LDSIKLQIREYSISKAETLKVCVFDTEESQVAMLVKEYGNRNRIVPLGKDYPRLFFDFPLFGTEEIGFPVIINSKKFDPRVERDGIYLGKEEKSEILTNKLVLKNALENVVTIIKYASTNGYADLFHLYAYEMPSAYPWLSIEWLKGVYVELVSKYLAAKVISLSNEQPATLSLGQLTIPFYAGNNQQEFYTLVSELYTDKTPIAEEAKEWATISKTIKELKKDRWRNTRV
jgi:hypothetical protein